MSFPIPAPADLTNSTVNFAPGEIAADNPTAPPGKVCIYASGLLGSITQNSAEGQAIAFTDRPRGFIVKLSGTGGSQNGPVVFGTWAYTNPVRRRAASERVAVCRTTRSTVAAAEPMDGR